MRKDIFERMKLMEQEGIKPNFAEIARKYDCDYRTAKKYYEELQKEIKREPRPSKLDPFKEIIKEKVELGCSASAIYHFLKKKNYTGKYTILREYVKSLKKDGIKKATIRFETEPGFQAQVDRKERMKLVSREGECYEINIFLMILGYSRTKYLALTLDRNQDTLMKALIDGLRYFGGVPKEILFDNLKAVMDRAKTYYQEPVVNETFYLFSKDMGFKVNGCQAYRPQTKGKVEALAKLMSRLEPYNHEFSSLEELDSIVKELMNDINNDKSFSTNETPLKLLEKEKEYLSPLPNHELLNNYFTKPITRIVTKESMVTYMNNKYSLEPKYIGKIVTLKVSENNLTIIYNNEIIAVHQLSSKKFNYKLDHAIEILKSDAMKHSRDEEIEKQAKKTLETYDKLR